MFALLFAGALACGAANAAQADRDQPVNANANSFFGSQDSGKTVFTGNVKIDQGTLHADGDSATGYFDQNNQVQRVVLTGKPAHMQQKLDDGSMVHGSANTIDYTVSENTVVLTGDANVVQEHKGEFHGAKLTYNTDSGQISGESSAGGQVHLTLQPKPKSAPAKPKTTATQPAPSQSAAAQSAPASSMPASPAASPPFVPLERQQIPAPASSHDH
ncbi:MAG: lipopolysaccharide transport periplasmic protein LptA [Rhodanobacteraceae bacterium]